MANNEREAGAQPTTGGGPPAPPRDMGEQVRKVIPEDEAAAAGLVIGGMLQDLSAEEVADPSPYLKPMPEHPSRIQLDVRGMNEDDYDERAKVRSHKSALLWTLLVALGGAAVAAAFIMIGIQQPEASDSQQSVADVQVAPAAPLPKGETVVGGVPGQCAVAPESLKVASTETLRDRGVNDPAMFVVQWDVGVINNSTEPILVTARIASSASAANKGWDGNYTSVAPGEAHLWPMSYVTNNAGGSAGATTYQFVDRVLAVRDSPACAELLMNPTDEMAKAAIAAEVPRMPANAQLPPR